MQKVTDALFSLKEATASLPLGCVTKCFLIFIVDEVNNFAANIFFQLVIKSRTGIRAIGQSCTEIRASKGWRSYIEEFRGSKAVEGFCCEFQKILTRFAISKVNNLNQFPKKGGKK